MNDILWFLIDLAMLVISYELGKLVGLKHAEHLFGKKVDR